MQASDKYNERVESVLGRSPVALGFVAAGALATAVLVAWLPVGLELRMGALAWVTFVAARALRRLRPGVRLRVDRGGAIEVGERSGSVRDGSFVAPWLVVVRWRPVGSRVDRSLPVAPDMLGPEDFRKLRVLLRFGDGPRRNRPQPPG